MDRLHESRALREKVQLPLSYANTKNGVTSPAKKSEAGKRPLPLRGASSLKHRIGGYEEQARELRRTIKMCIADDIRRTAEENSNLERPSQEHLSQRSAPAHYGPLLWCPLLRALTRKSKHIAGLHNIGLAVLLS